MIHKLTDNVHAIAIQDWDRRLFDELITIPRGTSYNSYLVRGSEKTALIDTADPGRTGELMESLGSLGVETLDYIIANHCEQDHSGSIPALLGAYPAAAVVTNDKCRGMLLDHLHIPGDRIQAVADGQVLPLGGRSLQFIIAPWAHWPETMFTWAPEERCLFPCDFLGAHLTTTGTFAEKDEVLDWAKRYYAEIMMPFRQHAAKNLDKVNALGAELICPSHGPVHRKPFFILEAYRDWTSDAVTNEVVIPWVSMHGSTERMVGHLLAALARRGVTVKPFNINKSDTGELAASMVDAATIVLAAPTVLVGPHPMGLFAAALVGALKPKTKFLSIIGSYGWGSKAQETLKSLLANVRAELLAEVYIKGAPRQADFAALDALADQILSKHRGLGLL